MSPRAFYQKLGNSIRLARHRMDFTQEMLARHLGISRPSLANMEVGRQRVAVHQLVRVCAILEVSVGEILGEPPSAAHEAMTETQRADRISAGIQAYTQRELIRLKLR